MLVQQVSKAATYGSLDIIKVQGLKKVPATFSLIRLKGRYCLKGDRNARCRNELQAVMKGTFTTEIVII